MGRARFTVSRELLRDALHMPETSAIFNIHMDERNPDCIVIAAEDPSLPTGATKEAEPTVTRVDVTVLGDFEPKHHYTWHWNVR